MDLEKIVDFVIKYSIYFDREKIKEVIKLHIAYGTILCPLDKDKEIMGLAIWNIRDETAYISEVIVNPKYRGIKFIKFLFARGWNKFPNVKYINFKRRKYGNKERTYKMEKLI